MHPYKINYITLVFLLLFTVVQSFSQIDSLEKMLDQAKGDDKYEILLSLSKAYWYRNPLKSVEYAQHVLNQTSDQIYKARALNRIANGYYFLNEYKLALEYYIKSLELSENNNYSKGVATVTNNIGLIYKLLGDYDMAVEYYNRSLEIEIKNNNPTGILSTSLNLGNIYYSLKDFNRALKYYFDCLDISKQMDNKAGILNSYNNIGSTYSEINLTDSALYFTNKAYELSLELNNLDNEASALNNLGMIYFTKKDYSRALEYYFKSLKIDRGIPDNSSEANTLRNIGGIYLLKNNYEMAFKYLNDALTIAKKINDKELLMNLYSDLSTYYQVNENYKLALDYELLSSGLKDSIYNEESTQQIAETQAKYDFRNKDQQLQIITRDNKVKSLLIKSQRLVIYIVAVVSLLILALVFFFYNRSRINERARKLVENKNERITDQTIVLEKTVSELKESEAKYKSLIDSIQDGLFIIQDEKFIYVNDPFCTITGYTKEELFKGTIHDIISDEDLDMVMDNYRRRQQGEKIPSSYEFRLKHKSNRNILINIQVELIKFHGIVASIGTIKDITDQKEYENRLIEEKEKAEIATQSKSMFLAGMSHEIRNHMSSIMGISEVLSETKLSKDQKEYIDVIKASSSNLLLIINDILDFSKIEAGQIILEKKVFNLRDLIDEVIAMHEVRIKHTGLYIKTAIQDQIPEKIYGDRTRLSQILINLISNAIKFTDKGGITITVEEDQEFAEAKNSNDNQKLLKFKVKDTGVGISEQSTIKLFKPFSQTHVAIQRESGGTGLGLAICKQLIQMMGGDIGVESRLNKGSEFWFTIRFETGQAELKKAGSQEEYIKNHNGLKILLVEDNILNQQLTTGILGSKGYEVDVAENGKKGLELYKQNNYDIVLMDVQMPVMDGIQATRLIREYESINHFKKSRIIAVTAYSREGERKRLFDAGMDHYLSKPFKAYELIDMIELNN